MIFGIRQAASVLGIVALSISAMAFGPVAFGYDAAFAKGGNGGGGNGNSGGNGNGGGSKSASSNGGGNGASTKAKPSREVTVATRSTKGKLHSELKGLNAVRANPQALANAAPNSQVGRIAQYRDAALGTIAAASAAAGAADALAAAQSALDGAVADLTALDDAYSGLSTTEIDAAIAALDTTAPDYQTQLDALNADRDAAVAYEDDRGPLADAVADAQTDLTEAGAIADEAEVAVAASETAEADALLVASGGRELSEDAIAYIRAELGL